MRFAAPLLALLALGLWAPQADAASCSAFALIKSHDADKNVINVSYERGNLKRYFPRPEGSPSDTTKIPSACKRSVTKVTELEVKATGGRLTVTQVRSNFDGKMLNDPDDDAWLASNLQTLITDKTEVVLVIRPGMKRDSPLGVTTIYLPITEEELAEIKRLEDQAEDVEG